MTMYAIEWDFVISKNFLHQLEHLFRRDLPDHQQLKFCPPTSLPEIYPFGNRGDDNFKEKYFEKGRLLATFMKRKDLTNLLFVFTLLKNSSNSYARHLSMWVHKVILKKMRQCQEFSCWQNPQSGLDFFYKSLEKYSLIVDQVLMELLMSNK